MSDPRHMHEYEPNKRGLCRRIVGGAYCHLPELAMVHKRYVEAQEEAQEDLRDSQLAAAEGDRMTRPDRTSAFLWLALLAWLLLLFTAGCGGVE